jgi:phosphoribosylanthranilate isomerase
VRTTAVKICGLTRAEDVALACRLGAAYLGFNFAADSPRRVTIDQARQLAAVAPAPHRTGVFVAEDRAAIARAAEAVPLDFIQLHRPVTREDLDGLPVPLLAAVRAEDAPGAVPPPDLLARCHALLWDSSEGTGRRIDWRLLDGRDLSIPVFVAGGLDSDNVGEVIRRLRPYGVDVASGVESVPGIKDRAKLERFFDAVREADREAS